jgi:hypothetical protein
MSGVSITILPVDDTLVSKYVQMRFSLRCHLIRQIIPFPLRLTYVMFELLLGWTSKRRLLLGEA